MGDSELALQSSQPCAGPMLPGSLWSPLPAVLCSTHTPCLCYFLVFVTFTVQSGCHIIRTGQEILQVFRRNRGHFGEHRIVESIEALELGKYKLEF